MGDLIGKTESARKEADAVYDKIIPAGDGWMYELQPNQIFRIVDLGGNQAADTMFYDAENPQDHYSATADNKRSSKYLPHDRVGAPCGIREAAADHRG